MGDQRETLERSYEALRRAMLQADSKGMQSALTAQAFRKMGGRPDGTLNPDAVEALTQMQEMMDDYMPELGGDFTVEVVADGGSRGMFAWRPHPAGSDAGHQCVLTRFVGEDDSPRVDDTHSFQMFPDDYEGFGYEIVKADIPEQARLDGDR